jgi:CDP-diglyceride synthetase|tara:strand:+ start:946 stop:1140 length:195 start_codon:yes stop_codon:yes gene_type:complete
MNFISRTITGGVMIFVGLVLIIVSFFISFAFLIYSIVILIIGTIILLNKNEDRIEKIKSRRSKK